MPFFSVMNMDCLLIYLYLLDSLTFCRKIGCFFIGFVSGTSSCLDTFVYYFRRSQFLWPVLGPAVQMIASCIFAIFGYCKNLPERIHIHSPLNNSLLPWVNYVIMFILEPLLLLCFPANIDFYAYLSLLLHFIASLNRIWEHFCTV